MRPRQAGGGTMAAYLSVIRSVTTTTNPVNTLDLFMFQTAGPTFGDDGLRVLPVVTHGVDVALVRQLVPMGLCYRNIKDLCTNPSTAKGTFCIYVCCQGSLQTIAFCLRTPSVKKTNWFVVKQKQNESLSPPVFTDPPVRQHWIPF